MLGHARSWAAVAGTLVMPAIASGCASPPSRFFALSPLPSSTGGVVQSDKTVIAVGPVAIPQYLDRPQIVTRSNANELQLAEYDRWAGSLRQDLATIVVENLSELLREQGVTVLGSGAAVQQALTSRYRIAVQVMRFEAAVGGPVTLKAQWSVVAGESGTAALLGESNIQETLEVNDCDKVVAAMSRALASLSRDISTGLTTKGLVR